MKKPTMQQIAETLGVSKNSISLALSGKPGVSDDLRKKVIELAEQIGYPIKKANGNHQEQGHMIGLIAREDVFAENIFFGAINLSIEKEINYKGGHLLLHSVNKENEKSVKLPSFVTEKKVDGLLILSHLKLEYLQAIEKSGIPVVLIDHHHPELKLDTVLTDNRKSAYRAVNYMLNNGLNNIGFIGQTAKSPSYKERYEGYLDALEEANVQSVPRWSVFDINEDEEALSSYIKSLDHLPQAWLCANDEYGFIISRILMRLGYSIPEDISICGFDNSHFSELAMPALTTVSINKEYFAKRSIYQLYRRMENASFPNEKILLDTEFIERDSVKLLNNELEFSKK